VSCLDSQGIAAAAALTARTLGQLCDAARRSDSATTSGRFDLQPATPLPGQHPSGI